MTSRLSLLAVGVPLLLLAACRLPAILRGAMPEETTRVRHALLPAFSAATAKPADHILAWSEGFRHFRPATFDYYAPPNPPSWEHIPLERIPVWPRSNNLTSKPKVLLVGCRDWTFPTDYDPSDVRRMYSTYDELRVQNLDRTKLTHAWSKKTTLLPVGLDLHSAEKLQEPIPWYIQLDSIVTVRNSSLALSKRKPRVLVTFKRNFPSSARFRTAGFLMRDELYDQASKSAVFDVYTGSRLATWETMAQYAFVYSPIGNGFDCHRLWEALALGSIVIAQRNPTAVEFAREFPIVLVSDIRSVTEVNLQKWLLQYCATPLASLRLTRWLQDEVNVGRRLRHQCDRKKHQPEFRLNSTGMRRDPATWNWSD